MRRAPSPAISALVALGGAASVAQTAGCATVFRDPKPEVRFVSAPSGAEVQLQGRPVGVTPATSPVPRAGSTAVTMSKAGHDHHRGYVKKSLNGAWVTVDILTCVIPVALCVPLLVDAISGAWIDVDEDYEGTLSASVPGSSPAPGSAPAPGSPATPGMPPAPGTPRPEEIPATGPELRL